MSTLGKASGLRLRVFLVNNFIKESENKTTKQTFWETYKLYP